MSDTTPRDKLAQIISDAENLTDEEGSWALPEDVADEIIRTGWRPPARTVITVEEAEALRDGTLIVDSMGDSGLVWGGFVKYDETSGLTIAYAFKHFGPLAVVWEPKED